MTTARRRCSLHHLFPRCPGCESERHIAGTWQQQAVPKGFAEWLRDAAKFYTALGPISATEFAEAICVDLREVALAAAD